MTETKQTRLAEQHRAMAELKSAVGAFMTAFAMIESLLLTEILGSLSMDKGAMEYLEELTEFSLRLKLMLRLTEERYPALGSQAREINKAAKKLSEHRNKIAHNAAIIALAGGFDDGPFIAGIRKVRGELKYPNLGKPGEVIEHLKGMLITIEEIAAQTGKAYELQDKMSRFRLRIHHLRYGTPAPVEDPVEPRAVNPKGRAR